MASELLTRKQVAEIFNVNPLTIWHWEKRGILKPVFYRSGRPQYHMDDIIKVPQMKQTIYSQPKKKANG